MPHAISINFNDTQSAQNNSNHTLLIDHYIIYNHSSAQRILLFNISQFFYKLKISIANTNFCCLNHTRVGIPVIFTAKCLHQNEVVIRDNRFTHNVYKRALVYINITENLLLSNNTIQIENCLFSNNVGNKKDSIDILLFYGLVKHISISNCNFYNNSNLNSIEQRVRISSVFIPQEIMLLANIYISNTNFSLNSNSFVIYLWIAKLHLQGPIIIHNNTCSACVMTLDKSTVFLTNYIEFSANKTPNFIT